MPCCQRQVSGNFREEDLAGYVSLPEYQNDKSGRIDFPAREPEIKEKNIENPWQSINLCQINSKARKIWQLLNCLIWGFSSIFAIKYPIEHVIKDDFLDCFEIKNSYNF